MHCKVLPATAATLLLLLAGASRAAQAEADAATESAAPGDAGALESIEVVSRRLNEARSAIETQLGASVYTIDAAAIAAMPGGDNTLLNQAVMQAPGVAQDSFGQFHIRGEHNGLQYRLNGIILPEGITGFGQTFDPRLLSSMQLITGALPAEYGLRTAGIIDLTTRSGALDPGGEVSLYGGSHGTLSPAVHYGGSAGRLQFFVSADARTDGLGIESPDGRATPLHDRTHQEHAFLYLEDVVGADDRLGLVLSTASGGFQIPDSAGLQPGAGWNVGGRTAYDSALLDENQHEETRFAILSWQHSRGGFDAHTALTVRGSALDFQPDPIGDLLFDGISQQASKRNNALGWQADAAWHAGESHTLRGGWYLQADRSTTYTNALVLPLDTAGNQVGTAPVPVIDNSSASERVASAYLQDEWQWSPRLTMNYGLRADVLRAYSHAAQLSPRANLVWQATARTALHAGYARYFSPPPFELVGTETIARFVQTSAAPASLQSDLPRPERAHYFDVGLLHNATQQLTLGLDAYFKRSTDLIDEGQFGAPIILTPFNYQDGRQYGVEATANYAGEALSAYANLAWQTAQGRGITSAQFNFDPAELAYIATHFIALDHEQKVTASAGLSYRAGATRFSTDAVLGSGLRASQALPDGSVIPNGTHLPYYTQANAGCSHEFAEGGGHVLTLRVDVINVFDRSYQIRNGTGVGVGAPQFGARRGFFLGLSQSL